MLALLFILFAGLAIGSAIAVVVQRNPLYSAISLIGVFISLACLYVMLAAPFIAAVQVIVYAGAIMVLVVFVIMLLNVEEEARRRPRLKFLVPAAIVMAALLIAEASFIIYYVRISPFTPTESASNTGLTSSIGTGLFTEYLLPFEITSILLLTLAFGTMSAGAANAINCYIDCDIDAKMRRTRRRPLARHQVTPARALIFGVTLAALSTAGFLLTVNPVAAAGSLFAILFYVFVYSLLLKRRTSQNVVWGGIAGCMPVLIGWSAITGDVAWTPFVLFGVVFLWTPPHTWTLAMRYREDYAVAKVPMLPVVASERRVVTESLVYTYATVACSLLLWPVAGMGPVYGAVAVVLGLVFLAEGHRLLKAVRAGVTGVHLRPMRFFHLSNVYLALLFTAVAVDPLLH